LDARNYGIPQSRRRVFAISFNINKLNINNFEEIKTRYKKHLKDEEGNLLSK
jgi:site-specific DNA-cytosine methylase